MRPKSRLVAEINLLDCARAGGGFVDVDDSGANANFAFRVLGFTVNGGSEAIDDVAFLHTDDAAVTSRHSQISEKSGALVQDSLVGGLYVSVRAQHSRDPTVEKPAHRDLF